MATRIALGVAAFLFGTIAVYLVVLFGTLFYWELANVRDRDGGGAMGLAFVIAPVLGLLGGVASAWLTVKRGSGKAAQAGRKPMARNVQLAMAGGAAGLFGYGAARLVRWVAIGNPEGSYTAVLIMTWLPMLVGFVFAGIAIWLTARRLRASL